MTDGELRERRRSGGAPGPEVFQELLGDHDRATVGAFLAAAITDEPPHEDEWATLFETIAE